MAVIERLPTDELAWYMIMELNGTHDRGGASDGREIRSGFLEIALSFNRCYHIVGGQPLYDLSEYYIQAAKKRSLPQQFVLFDDLSLEQLTDRQLVELAIDQMRRWYEKDHQREDPINQSEYELAMAISPLIPLTFRPPKHWPRALISAWNDRLCAITRADELRIYREALDE